ncbi:MAG: hypothetical protein AB1725_10435, partial [Armatimonadota bacterium]
PDGTLRVTSVMTTGGAQVYNFEVSGTHTYFVVAKGEAVWVHNTCSRGGPRFGSGAKSEHHFREHMEKLARAKEEVDSLRRQLQKEKGKKKRGRIQEEITRREREIAGHEKEMDQKWPGWR